MYGHLYLASSSNAPKSSLPVRRAPGAKRPEILSKQFPLKIFLDFFLEKILKIENPMQIFSQKCLYAWILKALHFKNKLLINLNKGEWQTKQNVMVKIIKLKQI